MTLLKAKAALAPILLVLSLLPRDAASQTSYVVDHERSYVLAVVGVAGILGSLAHEHAVLATEGEAEICYSEDDPSASRVSFRVPTSSLRIDTRRARALAELDTSWPDRETREELQEKMLSDRFLAADRYEDMAFESSRIRATADGELRVEGTLRIRGRTNRVSFPVELRSRGEALLLRGGMIIRQTDFGMEPESIARVVRVADAVSIRFEILGRAGGDC